MESKELVHGLVDEIVGDWLLVVLCTTVALRYAVEFAIEGWDSEDKVVVLNITDEAIIDECSNGGV